ncbi:hypothetical protein ABZ721_40145 [Streptomyces sp. NPDC006733]|uniref:hypothetical protein n=1 Tax=Streptomyces sp. NPDC006733 TaxID=3155460 RepID=UPI0033FEDBA1
MVFVKAEQAHPELAAAAFSTVAQQEAGDPADRLRQIAESLQVFHGISRLPDHQMDITILQYTCGMSVATAAAVLGVPYASASSDSRHAARTLDALLDLHDRPGETSS